MILSKDIRITLATLSHAATVRRVNLCMHEGPIGQLNIYFIFNIPTCHLSE